MGCEDWGCGHHRLDEEVYLEPQITYHENQLSRREVQSRSSEELPFFLSYEEFVDSDFFNDKIDLWVSDIQILRNNSTDRVYRLQRLFIILWYMSQEDLFVSNAELQGWDSDAHAEDPDWGVYVEWFFSLISQQAVREFQTNVNLLIDGVVGDATKEMLYRTIYRFYHSEELLNNGEIIQQVFNTD